MSPMENKALIQRIFTDSENRAGSSLLDLMAEDVCWTITGHGSWARTFEGRDAVVNGLLAYVRSLFRDRLRTKAFNFIADGDFVVVEAKGDGNFTHQDQRYDNEYCLVFRLENGRIKHIKEYLDSLLVEKVLGPWPAS